jgi:hypothetical protein
MSMTAKYFYEEQNESISTHKNHNHAFRKPYLPLHSQCYSDQYWQMPVLRCPKDGNGFLVGQMIVLALIIVATI